MGQVICGEGRKLDGEPVGCGEPIDLSATDDGFRCVNCKVAFCARCIHEHFLKSRVSEQEDDYHRMVLRYGETQRETRDLRAALTAAERRIEDYKADAAKLARMLDEEEKASVEAETSLAAVTAQRDALQRELDASVELHARAGDMIDDAFGAYHHEDETGWRYEKYAASIRLLLAQRDAALRDLEAATDFVFDAPGFAFLHVAKRGSRWQVAIMRDGAKLSEDVSFEEFDTRDEALARARALAEAGEKR